MMVRMHYTNSALPDQPLPGKESPANSCVCPHWDPTKRSCLLVRDGLFLPIEQHVVAYCLSSQYASCSLYIKLAGQDIQAENHGPALNRRRSIRLPIHHVFRFFEIIGSDQQPGVREDDAWTIDLSEHGIRFATRQMLTTDTTLSFSLEIGDTAHTIEGTGRIIWSVPLANTPLFHAGIAFTEQLPSSFTSRYC